uniref:Core Histone H2A/H2B/H3 domain-containing protein n=1 Tax=Clytia hemisphaerica TaxID=252671 RepID=A0A7M5X624_9CNID
ISNYNKLINKYGPYQTCTKTPFATLLKSTNKTKQKYEKSKKSSRKRKNKEKKRRMKQSLIKTVGEIRFYQRTTFNLIPKLSFCRLIKELLCSAGAEHLRIQTIALEALQEATEDFIVRYFQDSNFCALHAGRVTLMVKDMKLLNILKFEP